LNHDLSRVKGTLYLHSNALCTRRACPPETSQSLV
jgi:hypothetical protein